MALAAGKMPNGNRGQHRGLSPNGPRFGQNRLQAQICVVLESKFTDKHAFVFLLGASNDLASKQRQTFC